MVMARPSLPLLECVLAFQVLRLVEDKGGRSVVVIIDKFEMRDLSV